MSPSPGNKATAHAGVPNQGLATLLVMIAVLAIIILFCCFAAPGIRDICRKLCRCKIDDPDRDTGGSTAESATIILLPYGRMLVVDRSVFAQYGAERTGINFMELSADLIREHNLRNPRGRLPGSTPSILADSDAATSKGISPTSLGVSPPAYEDIFGWDLPPSYSELSIMLRSFETRKDVEGGGEEVNGGDEGGGGGGGGVDVEGDGGGGGGGVGTGADGCPERVRESRL